MESIFRSRSGKTTPFACVEEWRVPADLTDARFAAVLAERAGEHLLKIRRFGEEQGMPPEEIGDLGDSQANDLILAALAEARPDDAFLSEESVDAPKRLSADRVWIIDPLDGTREFRTPGRSDWAVHIALWERTGDATGRLTASAVAMPAFGTVFSSDAPLENPAQVSADGAISVVVSESRRPPMIDALGELLPLRLVPMGSAGAKAMAVVRGEVDAYVHSGGQWEWDSAAPVGVALAAGFHATRIDGSPLLYNQANPYLPDLLICRPALAGRLLEALARL
jgi:3'(2'), 5'-bisphosphate nucleotidase